MRSERLWWSALWIAPLGVALVGCAASRPNPRLVAAAGPATTHVEAPPTETPPAESGSSQPLPINPPINPSAFAAADGRELSPGASDEAVRQTSAAVDLKAELLATPDQQPNEVPAPQVEPSAIEPASQRGVPIDFATALSVAAGENPQVAFSRQRINEAFAQVQAAEVLWVPSLRAGMNYNKHEGRIQDVAGSMIETSRGSVYSGLGAQAVGAGSPAVPGVVVSFHTKDALYQPRIAGQLYGASRQANRATVNDLLLDTALAYNDLLEAHELVAVADQTVQNIQHLAEVTADFAQVGQGLPADSDRAQAELASRRVESQQVLEGARVASVRLAFLLSQDPTVELIPGETAIAPIDLVSELCSPQELVASGLTDRPELAEQRYLVGAAVERLRRERHAPLVPSVLLGLSYGGNGGGLGDDITNYGDRMDFDAAAYWEVRNLGFGEQAARNQARASLDQARWKKVLVMDQIASEIAQTHAQVASRRDQIELAKAGISAARDSHRRNLERTQEGVGLPIEALQSIQALDAAQRQYVRCVADYNRAQFRLQHAIGWPIR